MDNLTKEKIIGIDESGRGSMVGSMFSVACVLLPTIDAELYKKLTDSKKIPDKKRRIIFQELIQPNNCLYSIGESTKDEIDKFNILNATGLSMKRALSNLYTMELPLPLKTDIKDYKILIDGNNNFNIKNSCCIVKGDDKIKQISAASIIAKVFRDDYIIKLSQNYQNKYKWDQNKGYGTVEHKRLMILYGNSEYHRKSFSFRAPF